MLKIDGKTSLTRSSATHRHPVSAFREFTTEYDPSTKVGTIFVVPTCIAMRSHCVSGWAERLLGGLPLELEQGLEAGW
jgi:hypothetical protein